MTRPTVACYCGTPPSMYAAIFVDGAPGRDQQIAWFKAAHSGPGHLQEIPARDWHGKEAELARHLRKLAANRDSEHAPDLLEYSHEAPRRGGSRPGHGRPLQGGIDMADAACSGHESQEEWRPVRGYEDLYAVSSCGRVMRTGPSTTRWPSGRLLSSMVWPKGYLKVRLSGPNAKSIFIHKLVLEAFNGPRPDGYEANHKDANPGNNHLVNLEWVTPKGNAQHSIRLGRRPSQAGENNGRARLNAQQAAEIRQLRGVMRQIDIAAMYGVSRSLVSWIHTNQGWRQ